jgi:periplasmic divalent cation tolerance protein
MSEHVVVLVTAASREEAEGLAMLLLEQRLVACANLVSGLTSLFWWEGKLDRAEEVLLVLKTRRELVARVTDAVVAAHSYEVCEVIALPILGGSEAYLRWIDESVAREI